MLAALLWGAIAASSLVIGGMLALAARLERPPRRPRTRVRRGRADLRVSFDLFEEGQALGGPIPVAAGLAVGALTYFALDRLVETKLPGAGPALALGALLDGIPEQAVLGIGLGAGEEVSIGLLAAIFVSNLPEAIGASSDLRSAGRTPMQIRAAVARRRGRLRPGHGRRLPGRRLHRRRLPRRHQRLRRRRPARDAGRFDDPGGGQEGRPPRGPDHRPGLRRRRRALLRTRMSSVARDYEISVAGRLGELASAFAPHTVRETGALSFVRVEQVDQAALFAVLGLVQELGLELCEVRIVA